MFDEHIRRMHEIDTLEDARKYIIGIVNELVTLKQTQPQLYKSIVTQLIEHLKGKTSFFKEIDGFVKTAIANKHQERFHNATNNKEREKLDADEEGTILATQNNIVKLLDGNKYLEFSYDTLTEQALFTFIGEPIWHERLIKDYLEIVYPLGDKRKWYKVSGHLPELKLFLHQFFSEERSWRELDDAIDTVAKRNQFDLAIDWMDNLPEWDLVNRMDFLYRYAGVTNKEWAEVLGHSITLTMVARCYEPGYNVRGTAILEGPENQGKSLLVKVFAFDYRFFTEYNFGKNNEYESARQFRGQVMVEIPDKGNIDSKTNDQIKAFITLTHDPNRRMHTNEVEHLPRRFAMVVTCNVSGPYLKGEIGSDTRWLPATCIGKIDFEAVRKELPQILAQAKYIFEYDRLMPILTKAELEMQKEYLEPRQIKPNYYYWVLDTLKLHRDQMIHEWDDGFTMDEMLGWCQNDIWFAAKSRTYHRRQITDVLRKYFHIDSIVKAIPVFYQTEDGPKTNRKYRYVGKIDWNSFIDNLED